MMIHTKINTESLIVSVLPELSFDTENDGRGISYKPEKRRFQTFT